MKTRILSVLFIFIIVSCLFVNNNVFAANSYPSVNYSKLGVDYTYKGYVVYNDGNDICLVVYASDNVTAFNSVKVRYYFTDRDFFEVINLHNSDVIYYWRFVLDNNEWVSGGFMSLDPGTAVSNGVSNVNDSLIFYETTRDIIRVDGTIFFPAPVQEVTLAQVLEKNNPVKTFQTMMSGIIPYLIALVVGLVAFWKAWQLLLKELRKA